MIDVIIIITIIIITINYSDNGIALGHYSKSIFMYSS